MIFYFFFELLSLQLVFAINLNFDIQKLNFAVFFANLLVFGHKVFSEVSILIYQPLDFISVSGLLFLMNLGRFVKLCLETLPGIVLQGPFLFFTSKSGNLSFQIFNNQLLSLQLLVLGADGLNQRIDSIFSFGNNSLLFLLNLAPVGIFFNDKVLKFLILDLLFLQIL